MLLSIALHCSVLLCTNTAISPPFKLNNKIIENPVSDELNPIPTEGGPFGPEQPKLVWHFHSFMTGVTKIHDFVCFSTCLVPVKLFWENKL